MRSVRFSPPPPTQIGSSSWTGRGSLRASVVVNHVPSNVVTSSWSRPRRHGDALLELVHAGRRSTGSRCRRRWYSTSAQPAPMPIAGPAAGEQVDGRDRLGQHGRVAVADRVDERAALAPARSRRPARRAWRRPRGRRRRRARRWRRRSGPRSRSSRSRGPRSASTASRSSSAVVCCRPVCTPNGRHARLRTSASLGTASSRVPARRAVATAAMPPPSPPPTPSDRASSTRRSVARRPGAAAGDGLQRPAHRLGRRASASCSPTAAATSSASTTATAGCRRTSTAQRVDPMAVMRRRLGGAELPAVPVHAVRHGHRRRRPARPPRHRAGPRRRRVDGRDDRPDDRHRAPRPLPQPDVGDELARRPARRQADAGGAGGAADAAADRSRRVHRRRRAQPRSSASKQLLRRRPGAASAAAASFDRAFYPEGAPRQLAAIYASGDRTEPLRERRGAVARHPRPRRHADHARAAGR